MFNSEYGENLLHGFNFENFIMQIDCNVPKKEWSEKSIEKEFEILLEHQVRESRAVFKLEKKRLLSYLKSKRD